MSEVRVTGIPAGCPEGVIWKYFETVCKSSHDVTDIFYPLLNNDAVVILRDQTVTAHVLTLRHQTWNVSPLPNQVFTKQCAWVEQDLSDLVLSQENYQEDLKGLGGVQVSFDKSEKQLMLKGKPYQIEWARRYLSALRDKEDHMAGTHLRSTGMAVPSLSNGDTLSNGDMVVGSMNRRSQSGHCVSIRETNLNARERSSVSAAANPVSSHATGAQDFGRSASSSSSPRAEGMGLGLSLKKSSTNTISTKTRHKEDSGGAVHPTTSSLAKQSEEKISSSHHRGLRQADADNTFNTHVGLAAANGSAKQGIGTQAELQLNSSKETAVAALDNRELQLREDNDDRRVSSLRPHGFGQADDDDTLNQYKSMPVGMTRPGAMAREPASSSRSGRWNTVHGATDLDRAEAAHRSERRLQSEGFVPTADLEDSELGAVGGYQSLQLTHLDHMDRGHGGAGRFSSLPYSSGTSPRSSDIKKFALMSSSTAELSRKHFDISKRLTLKIYMDDITKTRTEAVVNAANWELKNIGGVAGALAKAAGPEMAAECDRIYRRTGRLATAQVVKTKAYGKLRHLKYVLHTVGPIFEDLKPDQNVFELAQTFYNCLEMAEKLGLQSVTFPFISTGIFGMPIKLCVQALVTALRVYGENRHSSVSLLEEVHFINFDVNVVVEAIFSCEEILKTETAETAVNRMEDGKKLYGKRVFPYCLSPRYQTSGLDEERYGTWDSTQNRDAAAAEDVARGQHRSRQRSGQALDDAGPQSLLVTAAKADPRRRSGSLDRTSKTVTGLPNDSKASVKAGGRDPSPMPKPRSRSNSFSGPRRSPDSPSSTPETSPSTDTVTTRKKQPVIKQALTAMPSASSGQKKRSSSVLKNLSRGKTSDHSGNDTDPSSAAASETEDPDNKCPICLDAIQRPKKLPCGHKFCTRCVERAIAVTPRCPECQQYFGIATGTQPRDGQMSHTVDNVLAVPGFPYCGTITITYYFPNGRQEACHPNPGMHYTGTHRTAYLPNNKEGQEVLKMLQKAFEYRLTFTIGDSVTTGAKGCIVWNDIHHKTSIHGGPTSYGYPDPTYLMRVKEELAAKGITRP